MDTDSFDRHRSGPERMYVDLDDVISRTTDTYGAVIEREFGRQVRFEDLVSFDLKISFGLTDKEFHYFFDLVHQPDVLMGYEPVPGAVAMLDGWADAGHEIDIVTGRPYFAREASLAWLERHRVPFTDFTMVDKYNRAGNNSSSVITKEQLGQRHYDLAVEDSRETAMFLADTMGVFVMLYDRPWNRHPVNHRNIQRIYSWQEISAARNTRNMQLTTSNHLAVCHQVCKP